MKRTRDSGGKHFYNGKRTTRGQRTGSKIRAGLSKDNALSIILRLENRRIEIKWD